MKFLIEIRYESQAATALYTVLETKFPALLAGGEAEGLIVEGSWVAIETGTAFCVVEAKESLRLYDLCRQVSYAAAGVKIRVVPVVPAAKLERLTG